MHSSRRLEHRVAERRLEMASRMKDKRGGSVAEWLACWTQAQKGLGSNRMTHVTCRMTAKNRYQLRNTMLGNRV